MISKTELLRVGRGTGIVTLDAAIERTLIACWNEGLMRRDTVVPYTYTTQDGVVADESEEDEAAS